MTVTCALDSFKGSLISLQAGQAAAEGIRRVYPQADKNEAREILRGVLRHEFRHHLEFLGGIHNASSLEAEDEREKRAYLAQHRKQAEDI